jgi:hypothetical protein
MAPCCGKHLKGLRFCTVDNGRQVADHASGFFGQCQLDLSVQLLDDVAQAARNLKHSDLTYLVLPHPSCRFTDRTADELRQGFGWDVRRIPGWEKDDVVIDVVGKVG